jgi:gliding motility-associated-like protein
LLANGGVRGTGGSGTGGSTGSGGAGGTASGGSTNTSGTAGNNGSGGSGGAGGAGAGPAGGAGGANTNNPGVAYGGGGAGGGDSPGGRGAIGGILITYNTPVVLPATPTITSTPPTCTTNGSSTISNYDATMTYIFSPAGPSVGAGGAISGMTPGTSYTVIAREGSCDSNPSAAFSNGAQTTPPATPTVATTPPSCTSDGISTISNYNAAFTYIFSPAGPSAGAGGVISGMTVGTSYTVIASDGSCNSTASAAFSIGAQLTAPPVPTVTTTSPTCTANGNSTINNYNASFTYTFNPTGPSAGAGGVISGMTTGTSYTVTANDGGCSSAPSAAFSNGAATTAPAVPSISTVPPTCTADGSSTISNYNASLTYIFNPTGPSAGAGGVISGMTIGTSYTIVASDGSCDSAPSAAFSNDAQFPTPVATISGLLNYCVGGNTTLTASGGTSYVWTDASANNVGNSANVTVTQGDYTVVATDANGCTATASATVTEVASLPVNIDGVLSYCPGESTTLTAVGGTDYSWSNGSNTESITVTAGTYSVTATDASCSGTASTVVTEITVTPLTFNDITVCEDSLLVIDAGNGFVSYEWENGETTQTISPLTSGNYSVTVVDANGCSVSGSVNVTFSPYPVVDLGNDTTIFEGVGLTLSPSITPSPSGTATYFWQPTEVLNCATCESVVVTTEDTTVITLVYADQYGCISSDSVVINTIPIVPIYIPNAFSPNKDGANDVFKIYGGAFREFYLTIHNRWGQKVFESNDFTEEWDGTFKGTEQEQGVYVYYLKAVTADLKVNTFKGSIVLLR